MVIPGDPENLMFNEVNGPMVVFSFSSRKGRDQVGLVLPSIHGPFLDPKHLRVLG